MGESFRSVPHQRHSRIVAELLQAAGVDTVKAFRNRVPENLHTKLEEVNKAKGLTGRIPTLAELTDMIQQAKQIEPKVTY